MKALPDLAGDLGINLTGLEAPGGPGEPTFRNTIGPLLLAKARIIKDLGNQAAHIGNGGSHSPCDRCRRVCWLGASRKPFSLRELISFLDSIEDYRGDPEWLRFGFRPGVQSMSS